MVVTRALDTAAAATGSLRFYTVKFRRWVGSFGWNRGPDETDARRGDGEGTHAHTFIVHDMYRNNGAAAQKGYMYGYR